MEHLVAATQGQPAPQPTLLRGMRRGDLVLLVMNGIIGAGIFGLPSKVHALIGAWGLAAFLVCTTLTALLVLCFAEVSGRFERTGGSYLYAHEAFGPLAGFTVGWLLYVSRVAGFGALCNLLVSYLGYFWPPAAQGAPRAAVMLVVLGMLTAVNYRGVRGSVAVNNTLTVAKLVPILLFVALGLLVVEGDALVPRGSPEPASLARAALLLVYAFSGFETSLIPAGEVRDPKKNLPFALLFATSTVAVIYVLIQVVCVGTLPELARSERPLADAARAFAGPAAATVITVGALVSITGTLGTLVLATPRLPFAMGERGQLPATLAATHPRFRTPHVSIAVTSLLGGAVALSGTFTYAVTIATCVRLLVYVSTCLAMLTLRWRERSGARPPHPTSFRAPLGSLASIGAIGLCAWLLTGIKLTEARDTLIAAALGLVLHGVHGVATRRRARLAGG